MINTLKMASANTGIPKCVPVSINRELGHDHVLSFTLAVDGGPDATGYAACKVRGFVTSVADSNSKRGNRSYSMTMKALLGGAWSW